MNFVQFPTVQVAKTAFALSQDITFKCALCGCNHKFTYNHRLHKHSTMNSEFCLHQLNPYRFNFLARYLGSRSENEILLITLTPEEFEKIINTCASPEEKEFVFTRIKKLYYYRNNDYPYSFEVRDEIEDYVNFNTLEEAEKTPLDTKFKCAMCGKVHVVYDIKSYYRCIDCSRVTKRRADVRHLMLTPEAFIKNHVGKRAYKIYRVINYSHHWNIVKLPKAYRDVMEKKKMQILC